MLRDVRAKLAFDEGIDPGLDVRRASVAEEASEPFLATIDAVSTRPDIDLAEHLGRAATLRLTSVDGSKASWSGVLVAAELSRAEPTGLSTYSFRLASATFRLSQRSRSRIFQHQSIPEIAAQLLDEWGITVELDVTPWEHPRLAFKVQYSETDERFLRRILEEAGITMLDRPPTAGRHAVRLADAPERTTPSARRSLAHINEPARDEARAYATRVRVGGEVRPNRRTIRDADFARPDYELLGDSSESAGRPDLEHFEYRPGAFKVERDEVAGHDADYGVQLAARGRQSDDSGARLVTLATNLLDLEPGVVFAVAGHPLLDEGRGLLTLGRRVDFDHEAGVSLEARAAPADRPHRPRRRTERPHVGGVEIARVTGPEGREIHVDEYGRVKLLFPWDREDRGDASSSCWVRVSQTWAGASFGQMMLPRVGQEVIVAFLDGNPDEPIVVGRLFNASQPTPYKLPAERATSGVRSDASLGHNGYNELRFVDDASSERLDLVAERDLRKVVGRDQTSTVVGDRTTTVTSDAVEATVGGRVQVVEGSRMAVVALEHRQALGSDASREVKGASHTSIDGSHVEHDGVNKHVVVERSRLEVVNTRRSLAVGAGYRETAGSHGISTGSYQVKVGRPGAGDAGIEAKDAFHLLAGPTLVLEAGVGVVLKAGGNFVQADASGVVIVGTVVKINDGGTIYTLEGAHPGAASPPQRARAFSAKGQRVPTLRIVDGATGAAVVAPAEVVTGKRASYTFVAEPTGKITEVSWAIEGQIVKGYSWPDPAGSPATVHYMTSYELARQKIEFYWLAPGSRRVEVTALVDGIPARASVVVDVKGCELVVLRSSTGQVAVDQAFGAPTSGSAPTEIRFGKYDGPYGIDFHFSTQPPTGGGSLRAVQLIYGDDEVDGKKVGDSATPTGPERRWALDGSADYPEQKATSASVTSYRGTNGIHDSLTLQVLGNQSHATMRRYFRTHFMFKPGGASTIWVSLGYLEWHCVATAAKVLGSYRWQLQSVDASHDPDGVTSDELPVWSTVSRSGYSKAP